MRFVDCKYGQIESDLEKVGILLAGHPENYEQCLVERECVYLYKESAIEDTDDKGYNYCMRYVECADKHFSEDYDVCVKKAECSYTVEE